MNAVLFSLSHTSRTWTKQGVEKSISRIQYVISHAHNLKHVPINVYFKLHNLPTNRYLTNLIIYPPNAI